MIPGAVKYRNINKCRISGSANLIPILDLGTMALTGVFPRRGEPVTTGPLSLVLCPDSGLVQLHQSYDLGEMYGKNYGYRSGLNASMVRHLQETAEYLQHIKPLSAFHSILDIGGNDGTFLKAFKIPGLVRFLIDPTAGKWGEFLNGTGIRVVEDFFSSRALTSGHEFDIITSIACFYDLEDPNTFVADIKKRLAPEGIWYFEQSYLPTMISTMSYDTICHEHLEFYTIAVVQRLLAAHEMRIIDVRINSVNGGSFSVVAVHEKSKHEWEQSIIGPMLEQERSRKLENPDTYLCFARAIRKHREQLIGVIGQLNRRGKNVAALGASTKGNVLLQYCGFTSEDIEFVSDVNPDKHGKFTPGSLIPIIGERDARIIKPDYMLVLPWHFRKGIIEREHEYLASGGHLIFPLPEIAIV